MEENNTENSAAQAAEVFEARVADDNKKSDHFLPISILVAAVLIGGSIIFFALYRPGTTAPAAAPVAANNGAAAQAPSAAVAAALALNARDVIMGSADAPVTVIEYGDYQCPFCTRYFSQVEPAVISNYVNTGKIKFVFRDFPFLDRFAGLPAGANESHAAGAAAECAKDQGKFWQYHDALYAAKIGDETAGGGENDGFYNNALFLKLAGQVGMNATTFGSCITTGKYASTTEEDYANAAAAGVNSTPMTFVNGKEVVDAGGNSVGADQAAVLAAIAAVVK